MKANAPDPKAAFIPITLESLARGILIPILSMILLEKGLTMTQLPLGLAICSTAIFLLEVPCGVLSDTIGRRRIFLFVFLALGLYGTHHYSIAGYSHCSN